MKSLKKVLAGSAIAVAAAAVYQWGHMDGAGGNSPGLMQSAHAAGATVASGWSPTEPSPTHGVYYPGTEALDPDEMRVIACGSGLPMPRLKQAAAWFLIELGHGD